MDSRFIKTNPDGSTEGIDPAEIPREELEAAIPRRPLLEVIRAKCLDCSAGKVSEVRKCVFVRCDNWPYRMGFDPYSNRKGNAANLAARKAPANDNSDPAQIEEAA